MIMPILTFSQNLFNRFCPVEKCRATPHCLYCDSLTLNIFFLFILFLNNKNSLVVLTELLLSRNTKRHLKTMQEDSAE